MLSDLPQKIEPSVTHRALGTLHLDDSNEKDEVWMQLTYPKYDHTSIECSLDFRTREAALALLKDAVVLEITTTVPEGRRIRIWPGASSKLVGHVFTAQLLAYESLPMESMISFDDDIDVVIELTRHGVLTPGSWRFNYDGTIERMDEIGPTITWQDRGKSFKLFMRYEFERAIAAEDWGAVRVARPCIHTRFHVLQPMEHRQVLDEIETSIEDSLLILSFVSRQWVRSYETTLETQAHGEGATSHRSSVRRRIVPVTAPWDDFFLIETKELIEGGFDTLVKSLRSSPLREALSRAIAFEVASRDVHSLESTMVLCHAALEAVIGGLDDRNPAIDHSVIESKNVRDAIADAIKTVLAKFQVPDETSKSVLKKVPELERAPIADLVVHHTERLRVNTQDLWPDSIGFEQGLRAALKRRNALVHAATIEKPNEAYEDMMRLQILTERIILHALEWPAEKVSVYHDQPIRRLMHRR